MINIKKKKKNNLHETRNDSCERILYDISFSESFFELLIIDINIIIECVQQMHFYRE